jgi:hypothetical protein
MASDPNYRLKEDIKNSFRQNMIKIYKAVFTTANKGRLFQEGIWDDNGNIDKRVRDRMIDDIVQEALSITKSMFPPNAPYAFTRERLDKFRGELKSMVKASIGRNIQDYTTASNVLEFDMYDPPIFGSKTTKEEKKKREELDKLKSQHGGAPFYKGGNRYAYDDEGNMIPAPSLGSELRNARDIINQKMAVDPYDMQNAKADETLKTMGYKTGGIINPVFMKKPLMTIKLLSKRII